MITCLCSCLAMIPKQLVFKFPLLVSSFAVDIVARILQTVIYRIIAAATITFSKRKSAATKRGWLLYEGSH